MKKVIIIFGVNFSGTSAMAHLLKENGAYIKNYNTNVNNYIKYEDEEFVKLCRTILYPESKEYYNNTKEAKEQFKAHFDKLPEDKVKVFKYPKAGLIIKGIKSFFENELNVKPYFVYIQRNPNSIIESHKAKVNADPERIFEIMSKIYSAYIMLPENRKRAYFFEEIMKQGESLKDYVNYCLGKKKDNITYKVLDKSKIHY